MDLKYLMLQEIEKEVKEKSRGVRIDRKVYSHEGDYQLMISRHWGSCTHVNFLPLGIHVYLTGKPETDRLFPYEDATSIEDTIAHIVSLLHVKPYKWQK